MPDSTLYSIDDREALEKLSSWLSHPNEMGRPPSSLEILDKRSFKWPPHPNTRRFWLIRFTGQYEDGDEEVGIGLVGSMTWSYFDNAMLQRPHEDNYAIHCYWELKISEYIEETDDPPIESVRQMVNSWKGPPLHEGRWRRMATCSEKLHIPLRSAVVASGLIEGRPGWLVMDGQYNQWYPHSDMPSGTSYEDVLKIHVGRRLLCIENMPDRKAFLRNNNTERNHSQIINRFQEKEGLAKMYVNSGMKLKATDLLDASTGWLINHVEEYAQSLEMMGCPEDIDNSILFLTPYLGNDCYELGKAAYICHRYNIALKYLTGSFSGPRRAWNETGSLLAEIHYKRGDHDTSQRILINCMRELLKEAVGARGPHRDFIERPYILHFNTFNRLYPDLGKPYLNKMGIPPTSYPPPNIP